MKDINEIKEQQRKEREDEEAKAALNISRSLSPIEIVN